MVQRRIAEGHPLVTANWKCLHQVSHLKPRPTLRLKLGGRFGIRIARSWQMICLRCWRSWNIPSELAEMGRFVERTHQEFHVGE